MTAEEFHALLDLAGHFKKGLGPVRPLEGRSVALIFEKPSLRTHVTFDVAVAQLGGHSVFLGPEQVGLGRRETPRDVARNLERWVDAIVCRTFQHATLEQLACAASVPVVNALSDDHHPCQALADTLTIKEVFGRTEGLTMAFIGDGNNVVNSLAEAALHARFKLVVASPPGYEFDGDHADRLRARGADIRQVRRPAEAIEGADIIYTDVWTSMGQEPERIKRLGDFKGYTVDAGMAALLPPHGVVMHCLPAHYGEEVTEDVLHGPRSRAFDQAENRLHVQKALLTWLLS